MTGPDYPEARPLPEAVPFDDSVRTPALPPTTFAEDIVGQAVKAAWSDGYATASATHWRRGWRAGMLCGAALVTLVMLCLQFGR